MSNNNIIMELQNIDYSYIGDDNSINILKGANFTLNKGEIVGLVAPSGTGKSTLLHLAGLLEQPQAGIIKIAGRKIGNDANRTKIRGDKLGFVYQSHHLLAEFSAIENIMLPLLIAGKSTKIATNRANELLEAVGLIKRAKHYPGQLSGGEQQRVAIGRALANNPAIILADEPTGNLDPKTAGFVFDLLLKLAKEQGLSALIATHNIQLAKKMDRIITIEDYKLTTI